MRCDAKIRPFLSDIELTCQVKDHDADSIYATDHKAKIRDYAYPGSETMISWSELDRRTFRGEWRKCPALNDLCILPDFHGGDHVK